MMIRDRGALGCVGLQRCQVEAIYVSVYAPCPSKPPAVTVHAAAGGPSTLGRGWVSAVLPFATPTDRGHHELFCFTAGNNTANGWPLEPCSQANVKTKGCLLLFSSSTIKTGVVSHPRFDSRQGNEIFLFTRASRRLLGTQPPIQSDSRAPSIG
jgi:hypothetical protein